MRLSQIIRNGVNINAVYQELYNMKNIPKINFEFNKLKSDNPNLIESYQYSAKNIETKICKYYKYNDNYPINNLYNEKIKNYWNTYPLEIKFDMS